MTMHSYSIYWLKKRLFCISIHDTGGMFEAEKRPGTSSQRLDKTDVSGECTVCTDRFLNERREFRTSDRKSIHGPSELWIPQESLGPLGASTSQSELQGLVGDLDWDIPISIDFRDV